MKKKIFITITFVIIIIASYALYMLFMPKRDVQSTTAFEKLEAKELVNEFLTDFEMAKNKYFESDGENKVLEVRGIVHSITKDLNNNYSVILMDDDSKAGVQAKFTKETNTGAAKLKVGDVVAVKGFITQGATFDDLLEIYQHVVLEEAAVISN